MIDIAAQFSSINIFKDILVPAFSALGALFFATRKFKKERIWQDKYAAYQKVLESIEAIRYWGEEVSHDVHMLPTIADFSGKSAADFYAAAQREVLKQTSIGTLLLSEEFMFKLEQFYKEFYQERFFESEEYYEDCQVAEFGFGKHAAAIRDIADKYLSELISLARKDLGT